MCRVGLGDVNRDLPVDERQRLGPVLLPQLLVPALAVQRPELPLGLVGLRVQYLASPQFPETPFQVAVLLDESRRVRRCTTPESYVKQGLWLPARERIRCFAGVEARVLESLKRTEPQGPYVQLIGGVFDEPFGIPKRQREVLDHVAGVASGAVQRPVQRPRVQEVIEKPPGEAVEGHETEVPEASRPTQKPPQLYRKR